MTDAELAGVGHNNPPSDIELLGQKLESQHEPILTREMELLDAIERLPASIEDGAAARGITPAEMAQKITTYGAQLQDFISTLEDNRKEAKKPFDNMASMVQQFFKYKQDRLAVGVVKVKSILKNFAAAEQAKILKAHQEQRQRDEEAARIKREEADRLAQQAAALAEAGMTQAAEKKMDEAQTVEQQASVTLAQTAHTAPRAIVRGAGGGSASTQNRWEINITDIDKIDYAVIAKHISRGEIEKACRAKMREIVKQLGPNDEPPVFTGWEIKKESSISLRK